MIVAWISIFQVGICPAAAENAGGMATALCGIFQTFRFARQTRTLYELLQPDEPDMISKSLTRDGYRVQPALDDCSDS